MRYIAAILLFVPATALAQDVTNGTWLINGIVPPRAVSHGGQCPSYDQLPASTKGLGVTTVSYKVATDGSVKKLILEKSGGSHELDRMIMKCAASQHFRPATKNGIAVEFPEKIRFDWTWKPNP